MKKISSGVRDIKTGVDVVIIEPCNLYECFLADGVFVGPFVEIQRGVSVGARTKIQSHSFLCELVSIGEDCFIGHGVVFINDTFATGAPAGGDSGKWKSTYVGNHVSIGSNASILPVRICDDVVIGAGAVVTGNIDAPGMYAGNPCRKIR